MAPRLEIKSGTHFRDLHMGLANIRLVQSLYIIPILGILLGWGCAQSSAPSSAKTANPDQPAPLQQNQHSGPSNASVAAALARLDLSTTIRPQDDFWGYVNQYWIDTTEIPADKSVYGTFYALNDKAERQIKEIIEETQADVAAGHGSADAKKIGNLYASYLDTEAVESQGLAPLNNILQLINEVEDHTQLATLFGRLSVYSINAPLAYYTDNDAQDQTKLIFYMWQYGLGLSNRDYYLSDQEKLAQAKSDYRQHIINMFALANWISDPAQQQLAADEIIALETQIAQAQWTQVQNRDRQTIYSNQVSKAQAINLVGKFDLKGWFEGIGYPMPEKFVIAQTDYFKSLATIVNNTPIQVWQNYLRFHTLKSFAPYLPKHIDAENFEFEGKKLRGQTAQAERWKRGVRVLNRSTGELLGKIYVDKHFPEQSKDQIAQLVENLRTAYAAAIKELEWMSAQTKAQALEKLSDFLPKLGYPDEWRDFSALRFNADTLVENIIKVRNFNHHYELNELNQAVDRRKWSTNPQTVNAFYRPTHNSITFPAGILQSPMFSPNADPALNYGAIGSIIGHEFSHGFDDQGRKFDGQGILRNWWTENDAEQYQQRAEVLVAQFDAFEPLPDTHINGKLTLGENIGDLAGLTMAYRAFQLSGYADGPSIAGLNPRQRFFIGYAVAFRAKIRDAYLRELIIRDSHSPSEYRVNGIVPNAAGFIETFNVKAGDGMYLPPESRAKIW